MKSRILVILGHPSPGSFCAALASAYAASARARGAEVRELRLGTIQFNPVLSVGYRGVQPLEPDLAAAQDNIRWADHLALVYPNWWGGPPALLKGFIERTFLPGFAFRYRSGSLFTDQLLTGRSADVLVTMDTPPWVYRWLMGAPGLKQMRSGILGFSGIKPVRTRLFGPIRTATAARRERWLGEAAALA